MADATVVWLPADNEINVPYPTALINVTFSAAIFSAYTDADNKTAFTPTTLATAFTFKETDASGADVAYTASIDATNKIVTIVPSVDLKKNQKYYLAIIENKIYPSHTAAQTASNIDWTTQVAPIAPTASVLNGASAVDWTLLTGNSEGMLISLNEGDQDCFIVVNNTDADNAASLVIKKPTDPVFWSATADRVALSIAKAKVATLYLDSGRWCNKDHTLRLYGDGTDLKVAVFSR